MSTLVYDGYCADPCVFRAKDGLYYAIGTAGPNGTSGGLGGRRFPLLRSEDLQSWELLGGALEHEVEEADILAAQPEEYREIFHAFQNGQSYEEIARSTGLTLPAVKTRLHRAHNRVAEGSGSRRDYWAPEVAVGDDGRYYMYYSAGERGEAHHVLHVAIAERPEGPYHETNALTDLAQTPFAIDAHPFRDADGIWYLFYAKDFLDTDNGFRAGTGLVMDRLDSMTRLAGEEQTVMRARHDWQVFQKERRMPAYENRVFDWYTLEGAFVVFREGRYWCFYSGSSYQTAHYGVDYVVADKITGPWREEGEAEQPRILYQIPGVLRGPGHNSVVVGPDGQDSIVFHAWDAGFTRRQMHIAPILWTPEGPRVDLE